MKRFVSFVFLMLVSVAAIGQHKQQQNACTLQSCRSFHELLNSKDQDILDELNYKNQEVYVCFRSDADSFFIARIQRPSNYDWLAEKEPATAQENPFNVKATEGSDSSDAHKGDVVDQAASQPPQPGENRGYYAYGIVSLTNFKNGQSDEWFGASTTAIWKAWGHFDYTKLSSKHGMLVTEQPPTLSASCAMAEQKDCGFFINNTVFSFFETYKNRNENLNENETKHSIDIRLSTERFSETYDWKTGSATKTGRCELYKEGKRIR